MPERLRSVLAGTLHDPSLQLAYWLPERNTFVDAAGAPVLVELARDRALTHLERDGETIAVLVHDPVLAGEPELVAAVAAGAGMAVQNEQLHAQVRSQLREVHASRARIVEAADGARRRMERDLHDGAQQRLVTVALALRLAHTQLGTVPSGELAALPEEAAAELAAALASGPTFAHSMTKLALHQEWSMSVEEAIDAEAQTQAICMQTQDFARAYRAFVDKKTPRFEGN